MNNSKIDGNSRSFSRFKISRFNYSFVQLVNGEVLFLFTWVFQRKNFQQRGNNPTLV